MLIGYSQLMKDIFNVDKTSAEALLERLAKHKPSGLRMKVLKELAKTEEETISKLLKTTGNNNTGGTHKTVNSFFTALAGENILTAEKSGKREYWRFTKTAEDLQRYLSNTE